MMKMHSLLLATAAIVSACASTNAHSTGAEHSNESAFQQISCEGAFDAAQPVAMQRFPEEYYWRGWPAAVHEVDGPLDLDGDGTLERVFIGTYIPSGGMRQHNVSVLVLVNEQSEDFETIDPDRLKAIFNTQMTQLTAEDSISNLERISFDGFLSRVALVPEGKNRNQGWNGYQYAQYFDKHDVFLGQQERLPQLAETRTSVVTIDQEPLLLLEATRGDVLPANTIITNYRFLARYLGDFKLQVLCGESLDADIRSTV
ncbi:MAG: hypothetical protein AAF936_07380 [Pseudomonadota bacterium]